MNRKNHNIAKTNALTAARLRARMAFNSTVQQVENKKPKHNQFSRNDIKQSNDIPPTAVTSNVRIKEHT